MRSAEFECPHYLGRRLRLSVLLAWGFQCAYCAGEPATHVDHVIPQSRGGEHHPLNLAAACPRCNLSKNARFLNVLEYGVIYAQILQRLSRFWIIYEHLSNGRYHEVLRCVPYRILVHTATVDAQLIRMFLKAELTRRFENAILNAGHRLAINLVEIDHQRLKHLIDAY